jgi:hypothetical protein
VWRSTSKIPNASAGPIGHSAIDEFARTKRLPNLLTLKPFLCPLSNRRAVSAPDCRLLPWKCAMRRLVRPAINSLYRDNSQLLLLDGGGRDPAQYTFQ